MRLAQLAWDPGPRASAGQVRGGGRLALRGGLMGSSQGYHLHRGLKHGWEEGDTESRAAAEPRPQRRGGIGLALSRDCRKLDVQNVGNG